MLEKTDLFEAGQGGYATYRIPGIVATPAGTLLAYCEARRSDRSDWGTIDVFLRRSPDGGKSWEPARKLVEAPAVEKNPVAAAQGLGKGAGVTVNNPVAVVDGRRIHFVYCAEYARCYHMASEDDGKTFSRPVEITAVFEKFRPEYDWKVLATGPGHGVRLRSGRLLVPVWLSTGTGGHAHRPSCVSVIYSDDGGRTWERGAIVASDPHPPNPSETAAVQLHDGRVRLNIRHEGPERRRGFSDSPDGGRGWSPVRFDPGLPEPVCMGSIVRLTEAPGRRNRILFSNPNNPLSRERKNLTVRLSHDESETWPVAKTLEEGLSGYSDLAVGPDGTLYCFYERGGLEGSATRTRSLCLARFDLEWLTDGREALEPRP